MNMSAANQTRRNPGHAPYPFGVQMKHSQQVAEINLEDFASRFGFFHPIPVSVCHGEVRRSKTRSVLKLVERGFICRTVLAEKPGFRPIRTPRDVIDSMVYSGDVVFGLDSPGKPRQALVVCANGYLDELRRTGHGRPLNPDLDGFIVLWSEGEHWGRRIKVLSIANSRKAYRQLGPEICMAIEARYSREPELRMAGEAQKIPI